MPRFPQPSGPKQFFTWVYFPSAWFLKNLLGYVSLSFTAPTCREESFHCASFPSAFWTQTNFDLGLLSISLVSQNLLGYISLSFTAPTCREESFHCTSFASAFWTQTIFDTGLLSLSLVSQKLVGGMFPSASYHQHVEKSRLTWP